MAHDYSSVIEKLHAASREAHRVAAERKGYDKADQENLREVQEGIAGLVTLLRGEGDGPWKFGFTSL